MTMSELSQFLLVSNGNVTGVVRRLHEKGWVDMKHQTLDLRIMTVSLTKEGRSTFLDMAKEHRNWISTLMSGVRGREEAFGQTLKKIHSGLDNLLIYGLREDDS